MTPPPLRTVLVGCGKVGAGYATDPLMARHYSYATHAQVLAAHPAFAWEAVIDSAEAALALARQHWHVPYAVHSAEELTPLYQPQVAVLAIPPAGRLTILEHLPTVQAVIVEKPLGTTVAEGQAFLAYCQARGVLVQVNLWRRADSALRALASGGLEEVIGRPQAIFGLYGNGLLNNGTHMVDLVRMLYGDIAVVQAVSGATPYAAGPLPGDTQVPFTLRLHNGVTVAMQPLQFAHYRENSLDIWGERARLAIMQEGLSLLLYPRCANRAMQGEHEIASDRPQCLPSTVGEAFYWLYDNLAAAVHTGAALWSPGASALQTARVIDTVLLSAHHHGVPVTLQ